MPSDDTKRLYDDAKEHLRAGRRPREKTIVDGVLGAPVESAPGAPAALAAPDRRLTVPRPAERMPYETPELDSDPPDAPEEPPPSEGFPAREALTKKITGRRRSRPEPAPGDSFYPNFGPALPGVTPSVVARAERTPLGRLLVLIAASATGLTAIIAALGAAVVNILAVLHAPSNAAVIKRVEAVEIRANGDFGLPLEVQTRQEKDAELEGKLEKLEGRQKKLEGVAVPIKVQPKSRRGSGTE